VDQPNELVRRWRVELARLLASEPAPTSYAYWLQSLHVKVLRYLVRRYADTTGWNRYARRMKRGPLTAPDRPASNTERIVLLGGRGKPARTPAEIRAALARICRINVDSYREYGI